tara:strand:- start:6868 stop:7947 length:1080 start_codon:yes stop_codon:yes gene_type:complete
MNDRLEVASVDHPHCCVSQALKDFGNSSDSEGLELDLISVKDLDEGLKLLKDVKCDILALPAYLLHGKQLQMLEAGCEVIGARTPRRPARILVSEEDLFHQPGFGILLAESPLVRRQLRRYRRNIRVLSPKAYANINSVELPKGNEKDLAIWMEDLRSSGSIDGFVTSREVYTSNHWRTRRHVLGIEPEESHGHRFIPVAYSDLVIFISRRNFPVRLANLISEVEGESSWWVQNHLIGSMDEEMLSKIGLLVRHRQVGAIMREAEQDLDLAMESTFHDPEGDVTDTEVHVEIRIEILSNDGTNTLSMERLVAHSNYQNATVAMLRDWDRMLDIATSELPEQRTRRGKEPAKDAWLNIDD